MDHIDPGITQERDAALESRVGGEGAVDEGQYDDGYAKAVSFGIARHSL